VLRYLMQRGENAVLGPRVSQMEDKKMVSKTFFAALIFLLSATTAGLAQSQRNYGANTPAKNDCYGGPYSGTVASKCPGYERR
jgi:hypothetical protein